ncbi:MAG: hydroxymethylbilane synthase [Anaerolineales bacterium]|nr:hydroxymethylbilane synthase [Anaerolineales bacterium]
MISASPLLTIATRPSQLARWQADFVAEALSAHHSNLDVRIKVITTRGDKTLDQPLPEIGGKGIFTQELEAELLGGGVDLAVHSLKDLPVDDPPGLCLGAILQREDPRDVLISRSGASLADLAAGSVVGTSSPRREAQVRALRPDLQIMPIRGNVETRIRKVTDGEYDAAVMAAAGVIRLGLEQHVREYFSLDQILPAPGQGALAVQVRCEDKRVLTLLDPIESESIRHPVQAERFFLAGLGGGCSAPVGAFAEVHDGAIHLTGFVGSLEGTQVIRVHAEGEDPEELGMRLANQALGQGAHELIADA